MPIKPMIIEGIITTEDPDGRMHLAPIGPHVDREMTHWILKPFQSSTTFRNLHDRNRAVFHIVDDGLLMVQAVLGMSNQPNHIPPANFDDRFGWILKDACRAVPLRIHHWDLSQDRATATCIAQSPIELNTFWGWNRAKHSLIELAVLWSRRHLLDQKEILVEFDRHRIIISKTAGDRELQALHLLESALEKHIQRNGT